MTPIKVRFKLAQSQRTKEGWIFTGREGPLLVPCRDCELYLSSLEDLAGAIKLEECIEIHVEYKDLNQLRLEEDYDFIPPSRNTNNFSKTPPEKKKSDDYHPYISPAPDYGSSGTDFHSGSDGSSFGGGSFDGGGSSSNW